MKKIKSFEEAAELKAAVKKFHLHHIKQAVALYGYAGLSRLLQAAGIKKSSEGKIKAAIIRSSVGNLENLERLSLQIKGVLDVSEEKSH
ncbi:hypothetical protein Q4554_15205 [Leptospira santarosai]|uniref:hypothetical protein n=1 Tax=Leptospira santarosai TaxID=28183 RepID=UPI0026E19051|nr:hypothetical protein [Leptospira santarosai]MDO6395424.1 hypothetical protein [Leptospira santarosai]